ncbi:MAG: hypothetical protein P8Z37_09125 [Acidobacteriota bacterium]
MKIEKIQSQIVDMLLGALRNIPSIRSIDYQDAETSAENPIIDLETDGDRHRIIIETRTNGQPRQARDAVALLLMKAVQLQENTYPVFAAPFISADSAEICQQVGAGHMDLAGNCRLAFNGIYVERTGYPNRFVTKRSLRSLYRTRSSRILRALLFDPKLKWKLTELSKAAGVSIGQVFNVKKALIDREWAAFDKNGFYLIQPEKVLRDWGEQYVYDRNTAFHFRTSLPPSEIEIKLEEYLSDKNTRHAFTSYSSYKRLVPGAETTHAAAYMDANTDIAPRQVAERLRLEPAQTGSNVILLLPYDEGVYFGMREIEGIPVVSPIQTFLDLTGIGNPDNEAENLMRHIRETEWFPVTES